MTMEFSHFNEQGHARMVDVTEKEPTFRVAEAAGKVRMSEETMRLVQLGGITKGDVLATAQIGGIMAAKRTFELIPMCHPVALTGLDIRFSWEADGLAIAAQAKCRGETGVEMEALTAVSAAALTVYDMCKAVQRDMEITDIRLLRKTGGKSGVFERKD